MRSMAAILGPMAARSAPERARALTERALEALPAQRAREYYISTTEYYISTREYYWRMRARSSALESSLSAPLKLALLSARASTTEYYRVLHSTILVLQSTTEYYRVLPSTTEYRARHAQSRAVAAVARSLCQNHCILQRLRRAQSQQSMLLFKKKKEDCKSGIRIEYLILH